MKPEEAKRDFDEIQIEPLPEHLYRLAKRRWDGIAKPLDSLGKLEDMVCRIAAVQGTEHVDISRRAVLVMCADNGIVEEGVTQTGQEVTAIVAANMARGTANICRMAKKAGADVIPVNIGIHDEIEESVKGRLLDKRIRRGTGNFLKEPAMTEKEVLDAIEIGASLVKSCKEKGYRILATGEMGIGNTTTSAAVVSMLLNMPPEDVAGRGAGLDDAGLQRKTEVIRQAVEKYDWQRGISQDKPGGISVKGKRESTDKERALWILQCVGGLDIAGLVGVFLGGGLYHVPIVIDGVISAVAALTAERIFPGVREYMLPSHMSREKAAAAVMRELRFSPLLDGNFSLGEGTGAVMLFPLLDMALEVYRENTTFEEIRVEQYKRYDDNDNRGQ